MAKGTWWEHAVMLVRLVDAGAERWTFEAKAWVDDREIYAETLSEHSWSRPLAHLGREGWELVGTAAEEGGRMNFFFKRPRT